MATDVQSVQIDSLLEKMHMDADKHIGEALRLLSLEPSFMNRGTALKSLCQAEAHLIYFHQLSESGPKGFGTRCNAMSHTKIFKAIQSAKRKYYKSYETETALPANIQFDRIMNALESCKSTKVNPLIINQAIAEYAVGQTHICSNHKCNEIVVTLPNDGQMNRDELHYNHYASANQYFCRMHVDDCQAPCSSCNDAKLVRNMCCDRYLDKCWNDECDRHEVHVLIMHCIECGILTCFECTQRCLMCNQDLCPKCAVKYQFDCVNGSSINCSKPGSAIKHPSCSTNDGYHRPHCECLSQLRNDNVCYGCVKHSCARNNWPFRVTATVRPRSLICHGSNCNWCKAKDSLMY